MPDAAVESIEDFTKAIRGTGFADRAHAHVRVWYRGQCDGSLLLQPGIYRPRIDKVVGETNEKERLELEYHLTQDFQVEAAGLLSGHESREELYFLQQHYGLPTRLLDWTHRPLAALYFAVTDHDNHHQGKDGAVYMMDAYTLAPTQGKTDSFRGAPTSRHPRFQEQLKAIFEWNTEPPNQDFVMAVRPFQSERRVSRQHSCFTFHNSASKILTKDHADTLTTLTVPHDAKPKIQSELFTLGMDPFEIYGDLQSLAHRLKEAYKIPLR